MGCNFKAKKQLFAKAALARSSRASSGSRHSTRPSTPLLGLEDDLSPGPFVPSTPSMSPMPPDPSDVSSDGGIEERSTYSLPMDNHSPDGPEVWIYETPESDWTDNGYGTDDDLSELEGDELEESLMRQKELEEVSVQKDDKGTKDAFHTLMRRIQPQEWKKVESNRHLGYTTKDSERTKRRHRAKERERKAKDLKSQKS